MGHEIEIKFRKRLKVSDIAKFFNLKMYGQDFSIKTAASLDNASANALTFSNRILETNFLEEKINVCIITMEIPDNIGSNAVVITDNPRLIFAKILVKYFVEKRKPSIGKSTFVHPTAKIGKNVFIGNGCTLGQYSIVGDYTEIHNNVVIADNVIIGKHCRVKSNTVIGEKGFGFAFEADGTPFDFPHLKSVKLGDHVEIGALNTIVGGALNNTIVQSYVKTDDQVHIAHNCFIGAKTVITACSEISGSVTIGEKCWLGPNCSIMNKIKIGDNCLIGLGAVVLKDVPTGSVIAGNPATLIRNNNN